MVNVQGIPVMVTVLVSDSGMVEMAGLAIRVQGVNAGIHTRTAMIAASGATKSRVTGSSSRGTLQIKAMSRAITRIVSGLEINLKSVMCAGSLKMIFATRLRSAEGVSTHRRTGIRAQVSCQG